MLASFPYSFSFFYVYEIVRRKLPRSYWSDLTAAVAGEAASNILRNPLEYVKQQLMVGRESRVRDSLKNIYKQRGAMGFYTGYGPTLLRDVSFTALQMPIFERIKPNIGQKFSLDKEDPKVIALAGTISAFISAFFTCPFDVIKTRHQTARMSHKVPTILEVAREIYQEKGLPGFFKGVQIRCGLLTLGGLFYFYSFGKTKNILQVVHT